MATDNSVIEVHGVDEQMKDVQIVKVHLNPNIFGL